MNRLITNPTQYNLYFIAVLIPSPFNEELTNYKRIMAEQYGSREALRVMPHFTLKTPMKLPSHLHEQFVEWFQAMRVTVFAFQQEVDGFGAFHNKNNPVIFAKTGDMIHLKQLQKEIIFQFQKSSLKQLLHPLDISYSPHATIAYRDLSLPAFQQAWQEFETKEYHASFNINSFHLLQHDRKDWQSISEFHLPTNT